MNMLSKILCTGVAAFAACAAHGQVVISQIYPSGGNTGAAYRADAIELFNKGTTAVDISGWTLNYASATGSFGSTNRYTFPVGTTIQGSSYLLIKTTRDGTNGIALLPTPDIDAAPNTGTSDTINMSGTAGKLALTNNSTALSGTCPTGATIIDFVGYGTTANCFEGTGPAPAPGGNANSLSRASGGCVDTNQNASNFSAGAISLRSATTGTNVCTPSTPPSGTGSVSPSTTCPGSIVTFTVTTTPGTNPTSPIVTVTGDFGGIGGSSFQSFTEGPTNTWTFSTALNPVAPGTYNFPVTITDAQSRVGNASLSLVVTSCNPQIASGTGAADSGICNGSGTTLTVNVTPGQNPTSASYTVTADLTLIGGAASVPFTQSGPTSFTLNITVPNGTAAGTKALPISITDDQARTDTGTITIVNAACTNSSSQIVISQVYGGGGNTGSVYQNDFVELFNRGGTAVDVTGWSVQYASASDANGGFGSGNPATNVPIVLSGTIQPGKYYLVQLSQGAGGTTALPTPDATGGILVGATGGRIALVNNSTALLTNCASASIVDLVGYGTGTGGAICYEGLADMIGPVVNLANTTAAIRDLGGCQDTDRNRIDFSDAIPTPRNSASPANNCVPVVASGACCVTGVCSITTQAACTGTYQGNNSTCSPNPCAPSTGACCNGGSCSIQTSAFCGSVGGTYQGNGSACSPNPCAPSTGVCCRGATCSLTTSSACTASGTAGATFVGGPTCNSGSATSPCCYADYNKAGGISVQDIFDFLNDWFAGSAFANTGGNGTGNPQVQSIFDFLNAWFAGGC